MKHSAAFGGLVGFLLVVVVGMTAGRDPGQLFLEASAAAFLGAFLMRWLNRVLLRGVHASLVAREQAANAEQQSENEAKAETFNT